MGLRAIRVKKNEPLKEKENWNFSIELSYEYKRTCFSGAVFNEDYYETFWSPVEVS